MRLSHLHKRQLVYPFRISTDKIGRRQKGTSAFLPRNAAVPQELLKNLAAELRLRRNKLPTRGRAANEVSRERQRLAEQSDFFIKPVNARIRAVRERLIRAGIAVEQPIEDLKNNTELFRRGNFREVVVPDKNSPNDYTFNVPDREDFSLQLKKLVIRMHAAGVSHNHFHMRNILISPTGKLQVLDLSRARFFSRPIKNKSDFLKRFADDMRLVSVAVASLRLSPNGKTVDLDQAKVFSIFTHEISTLLSQHEAAGIPTFGATYVDVINSHYFRKRISR